MVKLTVVDREPSAVQGVDGEAAGGGAITGVAGGSVKDRGGTGAVGDDHAPVGSGHLGGGQIDGLRVLGQDNEMLGQAVWGIAAEGIEVPGDFKLCLSDLGIDVGSLAPEVDPELIDVAACLGEAGEDLEGLLVVRPVVDVDGELVGHFGGLGAFGNMGWYLEQ